jgi:hypothetical protein
MQKGRVIYDRSGDVKEGVIWRLALEHLWEVADKSWVCHSSSTAYVTGRDVPLCKRHPKNHLKGMIFESLTIPTLMGGSVVPDFLPIALFMLCPVVSERFAVRLAESKLTKFEFKDIVKIQHNQSDLKSPSFRVMQVNGSGGRVDRRWKVIGVPNVCGHCGKGQIVCSSCGIYCGDCDVCGKPLASAATNYREGTLMRAMDDDPFVVDESEWDGSDFFTVPHNHFVTKRAKDWLESTHTFPLKLEPALLAVKK